MSMIFGMIGLTPEQIGALRNSPSLAQDIFAVSREDNGAMQRQSILERLPPDRKAQAEERMRAMEANPQYQEVKKQTLLARERLSSFQKIEPALDLQKSWHILHYAFTGDIGPVDSDGDALLTGEDVGEDFTGYGPPRLHDTAATQKFSTFLDEFDPALLAKRIKYQPMLERGVYSMPMGQGTEAEFESQIREEAENYFPMLRDYVRQMADKGNGLLMWIT
jgi:hypothetical protein